MDDIRQNYNFQISHEFFKNMNSSVNIINKGFSNIIYTIMEEDNKIYLVEHYHEFIPFLVEYAIIDHEEKCIKYDINYFNPREKFYFLVMLIKGKNSPIVNKILNEHTDINISDENNLLLNLACYENLYDVVLDLINNGIDVTLNNNIAIKITSIYSRNCCDIINLLIDNGAYLHVDDDYVLCCASHSPYLFKYLIDLGYEYNFSTRDHYCLRQCIKNYFSYKNKLYYLEPENNLSRFELENDSPHSEFGMIRSVNDEYSFIRPMSTKEDTLYDMNNKPFVMSDIIKYLLDLDVDINCCNGFIVNYVIEKSDIFLTKLIIENGANLNLVTNDTLSRVIHYRNYEMVSFLIESGIDFSRLNNTPINNFKMNKMVNLLIDQGMNFENIIDLI
ncbi:repeat protein [Moumouvirus goulette]|uniref:Repeat protein n=1 Tax=Moumouvirus goulette TaxID=1247379 RepID=M1PHT4_9VIRU|nr:repeat protein [Moumouvirus goulette]AGF85653.1 repeat protein [Moumouvirus goulette]